MNLGQVSIDFVTNFAAFQKDVESMRKAVGGAMEDVHGWANKAAGALKLVGITVTAGAFVSLIKGSIDSAGALHDLSIKTGLSVESLAKFNEVGRYSGVSAEQVGQAMNRLAKGMAVTNDESKGVGAAIAALGIDFDAFRRLSPDQQMEAVAKAMNRFEDGSSKSAIAMTLFGKAGADLLPFMKDLALAGDLNVKVTAEQAAQADEFGDNLTKLKIIGGAWSHELAMGMVPALSQATGAFAEVWSKSGGLREEMQRLAKSGQLTEWTQTAIRALSYLLDFFAYLWRTLQSFGEWLGMNLAKWSVGFISLGEAAKKALAGDFKGAWDTLLTAQREQANIADDFAQRMKKLWSEKTLGQYFREVADSMDKARPATKAATEQLNFNADTTKKDAAAAKELKERLDLLKTAEEAQITVLKTLNKERQDEVEKIKKRTEEVKREIEKQREANDAMRYSTDELNKREVASLRDAAATIRRNLETSAGIQLDKASTQAMREQAAALDELANEKAKGSTLELARKTADEWKKSAEQIYESLTDALLRAFETGKGFGRAFVDTLKNMLQTLILQPLLKAILAPVAGAIGSLFGVTAAAGTGGASGGVGLGGMLTSLKSVFSSNSLTAWGGGLLGGYMGGKLISGQYGSGATVMAGTGIGALVGGPLGALVGGLIGGVVNRLFGRGPKKITEKGIVGDVIGGEFDGQLYADWKRKGGLFRKSKRGTDYSAMDDDLAASMSAAGAEVYAGVSDYARMLGLATDGLASINHHLRVTLTDDEAENERRIKAAFQEYGDKLAGNFSEVLRPFQEVGETLSGTLERLAVLQAFSETLNGLGGVFSRVAALGVRAREDLVAMAGGIEALAAKANAFVTGYYSEEEQAGIGARALLAQLSAAGIDGGALGSRAEMRALVEAVDVSTSAGREQLVALLDVAENFLPIAQYLEENGKTLAQLAEAAPQTALLQSVLDDTEIQTEYQERTADGVDVLNGTVLGMSDRLAAAIAAMHGDVSAALLAIASATGATYRLLDRMDDNGALVTTTEGP